MATKLTHAEYAAKHTEIFARMSANFLAIPLPSDWDTWEEEKLKILFKDHFSFIFVYNNALLSKNSHNWQQAADYYAHSINLRPNTLAYLELAELMESISEQDNAYICYNLHAFLLY